MNKPRLGGWLRLWVVFCLLYAAAVAIVTWLDFPTRASTITRESFMQAVPKRLAKKAIGIPLAVDDLLEELGLAERAGKTERAAMLAEEIRRLQAGEARNAQKPIFLVRGPDGNLYSISGPPGAKASDVYGEVWKSWREQIKGSSTPLWKSDPIILEMDDGFEIAAASDTTEAELNQFRTIWKRLSTEQLSASRWQAVRTAFLFWMIPSFLLLALGVAVRWIYRGFRGPRGDAV